MKILSAIIIGILFSGAVVILSAMTGIISPCHGEDGFMKYFLVPAIPAVLFINKNNADEGKFIGLGLIFLITFYSSVSYLIISTIKAKLKRKNKSAQQLDSSETMT